ncbi:hypothetical protein KBC86_00815 [Candidatus Gracilibacteria bacterium]|nr:hypothetical protein [Candidatus Gracilibacteria bacterium]
MSGGHHAPSHGHGGDHGGLDLGTAKSWFATKAPSTLNPLSATDAVAYNVVDGVVVNATNATADILDAGATAAMNLGSLVSPDAYRKHGAMNIVKSVSGAVSHAITTAANGLGTLTRGADAVWTKAVTNNLVDLSSGTVDRLGPVGRFIGNIPKAINALPAGILRGVAWVQGVIDSGLKKWNSVATEQAGDIRLTTAHAAASGHGGGHH